MPADRDPLRTILELIGQRSSSQLRATLCKIPLLRKRKPPPLRRFLLGPKRRIRALRRPSPGDVILVPDGPGRLSELHTALVVATLGHNQSLVLPLARLHGSSERTARMDGLGILRKDKVQVIGKTEPGTLLRAQQGITRMLGLGKLLRGLGQPKAQKIDRRVDR